MRTIKGLALVLSISGLYGALIFVAASFTGAGHGSYFFGSALLAPFSGAAALEVLGFGLWPVVGILLALRRVPACRIAAGTILVLHYFGIAMVSVPRDWDVRKVWDLFPVEVSAVAVAYFGSQMFFWILIGSAGRGVDGAGTGRVQIAGKRCKICGEDIVLSAEGKRCAQCGTFVHLACEPADECGVCGRNYTPDERPKADPLSEAILPRALRPVGSDGPFLAMFLAIALASIAFLGFFIYALASRGH
jgi:hypothetical protein